MSLYSEDVANSGVQTGALTEDGTLTFTLERTVEDVGINTTARAFLLAIALTSAAGGAVDYGGGTLTYTLSFDGGTTYVDITGAGTNTLTTETFKKILDGSYPTATHLKLALASSTSPDLKAHVYSELNRPDGPTG